MPVFANPLGLLALLGIPVVLAIHFLQKKSIQLPVSTLFLLERTQRDAATGRRFERFIPSVPLWMQLLAILLLAWLLAQPRYQKAASVQRVAIVLDSSASMSVFKSQALARLANELPQLQDAAANIEFTLLESAPNRPRLYAGNVPADLFAAMEKWQPLDGLQDPTQALRLARSLVSREGTVIYLTDTPANSLPFNAQLIAVGEPVQNVGFTGVSFEKQEGTLLWRALVRNYATTAVTRTWSLQSSSGSSQPRPLELAAGAIVTLQAAFPADAKNVRLVLSADRFPLDDFLPLVAPAPKPLTFFTAASPAFEPLLTKLIGALDSITPVNDAAAADLSITSYDPLDPAIPDKNAILFVEDTTSTGSYLKGGIIAEAHPLIDGLNWQTLLVRETLQVDRRPTDRVLLWQDKRALIFLREQGAIRQLCFNFDLRLSNAATQPAFIVLLHRFAESIRTAKIAPATENLETNQPIQLTTAPGLPLQITATDPMANPLEWTLPDTRSAPPFPGFLTIRQDGKALLTAAVHFADTREADFTACGKSEPLPAAGAAAISRHTLPDPLWRVWMLLLIAALLVSWKFINHRTGPALS